MITWSYDPGQQGALAVLRDATPRPELLASWALRRPRAGGSASLRARLHEEDLEHLVGEALAVAGPPELLVVEIPAAGGRSRGGVRALALGAVLADARWLAGLVRGRWPACRVLEVESGAWCRELGVPVGKETPPAGVNLPVGWHRLGEAWAWARAEFPPVDAGAPGERVVARAEAALIGVAGLRIAARGGA